MHVYKAYMYFEFQQNQVCRSVKSVHTNLFSQYRNLHKFATTNSNFEKKTILLDMHHHKTYMYINFQQNQIKTQVMIVHTSLFAKIASWTNLQLPIIIFQNRLFQTCIIVKRTCMSIFSKIGLVDRY